jgi:hypothetical protein
MKKIFFFSFLAILTTIAVSAQQDKSKRASPPATVNYKNNDLAITIDYSQPSVKGRTVGKDIAPYGKVWRTGANEATTFEVNRDVKIEGQTLPAGKYSLYTIPGEDMWTIIFNKTSKQWGTVYKEEEDALRIKVKPSKADSFAEKMTFAVDNGTVSLMWGDTKVNFKVK